MRTGDAPGNIGADSLDTPSAPEFPESLFDYLNVRAQRACRKAQKHGRREKQESVNEKSGDRRSLSPLAEKKRSEIFRK
jgi:hypothetical protein